MGKFRPSGNIIIAGHTFATNAPVVTWRESGWDATSKYCIGTETESQSTLNAKCGVAPGGGQFPYDGPKIVQRYSLRPAMRRYGADFKANDEAALAAAKAVIRQFVVHHDGCHSSDMCFNVLQNERGLSCHFLIDNDGTIFQTIDLALAAWHAAQWNLGSIGVELCNYGDANAQPTFYETGKRGPKREKIPIKINGHKILAYEYTKAQLESFGKLATALTRLLPNIPLEFPQSSPGQQSWETLPEQASFGFAGYISHYHLTQQKWDPGPFDFKAFFKNLRGTFSMILYTKDPKDPTQPPPVPTDSTELKEASEELFKANEQRAEGGFFPVGPWGESRLWHGGIHLTGKKGGGVYAPFPGRLLVARMGAEGAIGSNNFVLLRHEMALGQSKVQFYSLYMHLADEMKAEKPVEWMTKSEKWQKEGKAGQVVLLDEPIEAGAIIGHIGSAGPADIAKAQIHLEFFSNSELFTDVPGSPWEYVDGSAGGRFCDTPKINDLIDGDKNGKLSRSELRAFYENGGAGQTRNLVTFHVSEWTAEPSWSEALRLPADFKDVKPEEIDAMVAEQITPGLWWDARVAQHARLPVDGVVHHYHPVRFVSWFNQQLLDAQASAPKDDLNANDTSKVPDSITDDFGDKDGSSARSAVDAADDPCNKNLSLNELVLGYEAPECGPQ
ncbi:MAG: N-acetylmuramoyl-L-alanine amidase [Kofleriaceae bacterium]|nr:N-acetylmuramoyl-L-alanine amidase [Kofleriaceae bacterium]